MCWAPTQPTPLLVVPGRRAGTDRVVTRKELVCGYPCPAPSPPATAVRLGPRALWCVWGGSEAGARGQQARGTASSWATSGSAQSPAVRLNGLPVLSRKGSAASLAGRGSWGEGAARGSWGEGAAAWRQLPTAWPRLGPSLACPSFCGPVFRVFRACGPQEGLASDLPELQNLTSLGVRWPRPPGLLHRPPLPGRPLPHPPLPALSVRRFGQDAPISSPHPSCGPWTGRSAPSAGGSGVPQRVSGPLAGCHLEVHVGDLCRGRAS